ncbi:MAG: hypothetical protein QN203_03880 [Armatimonadota bacterium]|nr:hypothetical protein [Armatimonadota bacterium]MDR7531939.1 hypothetical protein [Armatimonadota bacterium]
MIRAEPARIARKVARPAQVRPDFWLVPGFHPLFAPARPGFWHDRQAVGLKVVLLVACLLIAAAFEVPHPW